MKRAAKVREAEPAQPIGCRAIRSTVTGYEHARDIYEAYAMRLTFKAARHRREAANLEGMAAERASDAADMTDSMSRST